MVCWAHIAQAFCDRYRLAQVISSSRLHEHHARNVTRRMRFAEARDRKNVRGGGRSGKFTPFSCLSSGGTPPPSSFALRLILGLTHRQSLSAYTGLFRQRLLGRDCASLSGHLGSRMSPKAKYILECYSINVKRPVVRFCAETIFPPADKLEFGRVWRTDNGSLNIYAITFRYIFRFGRHP